MKNKFNRGRKVILLLMVAVSLLTGCGSVDNSPEDSFYDRSELDDEQLDNGYQDRMDKIYDEAFDRVMDPSSAVELEGDDGFDKVSRALIKGYHKAYRTFRTISPVIAVSSIVIGWLMMKLSRQNKRIRRAGLFVFIIGIPVAVIIAVFGIGILNGILLY